MTKRVVPPGVYGPMYRKGRVVNNENPQWYIPKRIAEFQHQLLAKHRKVILEYAGDVITPVQTQTSAGNMFHFCFHSGKASITDRALRLNAHLGSLMGVGATSDPSWRLVVTCTADDVTVESPWMHLHDAVVSGDEVESWERSAQLQTYIDIEPDCEYTGYIEITAGMRPINVTIFEDAGLAVDTAEDIVSDWSQYGDGVPITAAQHEELVDNDHAIWARNGTHLFTTVVDQLAVSANAYTRTAAANANMFDQTITAPTLPTADSPGFNLALDYLPAKNTGAVHARLCVYGEKKTSGNGTIFLEDGSGALGSITFANADGLHWESLDVDLDPSTSKVDIYFGGDGVNPFEVYSVCCYVIDDETGDRNGQLLLDLDFSSPPIQAFPRDQAEFEKITGYAPPDYIWTLDEGGGNMRDRLRGKELQLSSGMTRRRLASGFYNGIDMHSKFAMECDEETTTARAECTDTDLLEVASTSDSFAIMGVVRGAYEPLAGDCHIISKRHSSNSDWWDVKLNSSSSLVFECKSGGTTKTATVALGHHNNGSWFPFIAILDFNADEVAVYSPHGNTQVTPITLTAIATDQPFRVGGNTSFTSYKSQMAYLAIWEGASAEALTDPAAVIDKFWTHGKFNTSPQPSTYTRQAITTSCAGYKPGHGTVVSRWHGASTGAAAAQAPYGYTESNTNEADLGLQIEQVQANAAASPEWLDSVSWTKTNCTVTKNDAVSPNGMKVAEKLVSTAAGGNIYQFVATGGGLGVASIYIKSAMSDQNVDCTIRVNDLIAGMDIAVESVTATQEWQRVNTIIPASGSGFYYLYYEIDKNAEEIYAWGAQIEDGDLSSFCPATRNGVVITWDNVNGVDQLDSDAGEIRCDAHFRTDAFHESHVLLTADDGAGGNNDRLYFDITAAEVLGLDIYDSGGTQQQNITSAAITPSDSRIFRARWDDNADISTIDTANADIYHSTTRTAGGTTNWVSAANATKIHVGLDPNGSYLTLNGIMQRVRIWNDQQND